MYYNILKYSHQYTPSQAASFARFEAQNVLAVKNLVEEEGIDCDFVLTRAVDVYLDEEHSKTTLENFGKLKELGKADLREVEVLEGGEAEEVSSVFFFFFFFRFFFFFFGQLVCCYLPTLPAYLRKVMKMKRKKKKGKRDNPLSNFVIFLFLSLERTILIPPLSPKPPQFSKIHAAKSCFSYPAAHLHPYKLVLHLLRKAIVQGGVNLQTHTPVTSISDTRNHSQHDDGGKKYSYWTITTPRGLVRARKVIFCTNAYTGGIAPMFRGKIIPVKGVCCRILVSNDNDEDEDEEKKKKKKNSPPNTDKPQQQQQLPTNTYSLRHARSLYDYLIPRAQDKPPSIILGGAKPVFWHQNHQKSSPPSPSSSSSFPIWYNNPNDSTLFPPPHSSSIQEYFDNFLPKHFLSSSSSSSSSSTATATATHTIDKIWSGIMGWSTDSMPWIGRIPIPNLAGQFILAGFSGHGMPVIYLAAEAVARMVLDEIEEDEDEDEDDEEKEKKKEEKKGEGEKERKKKKERKNFEEMGLPGVFEVTRERLEREGNDILGR